MSLGCEGSDVGVYVHMCLPTSYCLCAAVACVGPSSSLFIFQSRLKLFNRFA